MIPVTPQPEPANFDEQVRRKGLADLRSRGISLTQPVPAGVELKPFWRSCLDDLYRNYQCTCAYLGVFFERTIGGASVEHFVAKSQRADLAYEWSNYRLASAIMNSRKGTFEDVLDPFQIEPGWFHLELTTGRIFANPTLDEAQCNSVQATIDRLRLDDTQNREMRARHYLEYRQGQYTADFLRKRSPFVYAEAKRQSLL